MKVANMNSNEFLANILVNIITFINKHEDYSCSVYTSGFISSKRNYSTAQDIAMNTIRESVNPLPTLYLDPNKHDQSAYVHHVVQQHNVYFQSSYSPILQYPPKVEKCYIWLAAGHDVRSM